MAEEPDSGIFRLSAAFCRGTSSHKSFLRPLFGYIVSTLYKGIIRQISLYFCHLVHFVYSAKIVPQKLRKPQLLTEPRVAPGLYSNPCTPSTRRHLLRPVRTLEITRKP
jgi:hypothetical protein